MVTKDSESKIVDKSDGETTVSSKLVYKFNAMPIKIPTRLSCEMTSEDLAGANGNESGKQTRAGSQGSPTRDTKFGLTL